MPNDLTADRAAPVGPPCVLCFNASACILATGQAQGAHIGIYLATPEVVLAHVPLKRIDATFVESGVTLSAALTVLLARGNDLTLAGTEAPGT